VTKEELVTVLIYAYGGGWTLREDSYEGLDWKREEPKPTEAELQAKLPDALRAQATDAARQARQSLFAEQADPLYFKWQRGEATKEEWEALVEQIRLDNPYPEA
jgi:hypothetical protein